jgi:hypothetical protein
MKTQLEVVTPRINRTCLDINAVNLAEAVSCGFKLWPTPLDAFVAWHQLVLQKSEICVREVRIVEHDTPARWEVDKDSTINCACMWDDGYFQPCCEKHEQEYVENLAQQRARSAPEPEADDEPLPSDPTAEEITADEIDEAEAEALRDAWEMLNPEARCPPRE